MISNKSPLYREPFNPERFRRYASDLSRAVYALSREKRMSIDDLKHLMADIPGIENLTMRLEGGKQVFSLGGPFVAVDPVATPADIETAIRGLPQKPSATSASLPIVKLNEVNQAMTAPSPTGYKPGSISSIFKDLREQQSALVAEIQATANEAGPVLEAGRQLSKGMKADLDAMRAELGQLTNFPPE